MILLKKDEGFELHLSYNEFSYMHEALEFYFKHLINTYNSTKIDNLVTKLYIIEDLLSEFDKLNSQEVIK